MLDRAATALLKPLVTRLACGLTRAGVSANQLTLTGFSIGLFAAFLIASSEYTAGAIALFSSRLCDALNGAVAHPARTARQAAVLPAAVIDSGSGFLAFAVITIATRLGWGWRTFS